MVPTPPEPPPTKPPLASLTLKGALAMALSYAAGRIGFAFPDEVWSGAAQALIDLVFALGLAAVSMGRTRARGPLN